ncbi:NAD(P)-dependent oxidoreductase [Bacillus phage vB_BceP_LY3]|uniref:NAD(P)-dependent oxidoreductase n=1 Tax=Bacillus phage vB_BceP_LY3 TaxID=2950458 RepID=A0AAE9S2G5_9CAUD|nr:NAD(P)-dependent oxidoreductase [Bacillus phage vB_BceP_LY3]
MIANALTGHKNSGKRENNDFYCTPEHAVLSLLEKEDFKGDIWECACGNGAISNVLINKGYNVLSTDIIDRNYGEVLDFLSEHNKKVENIITNPPYKYALEFIEKGLKSSNKIALLLKLNFLEGQKRKKFFEKYPPKHVHVFSKRLTFYEPDSDKQGKSGVLAFAWFVWEKGFKGNPSISWI